MYVTVGLRLSASVIHANASTTRGHDKRQQDTHASLFDNACIRSYRFHFVTTDNADIVMADEPLRMGVIYGGTMGTGTSTFWTGGTVYLHFSG